MATNIQPSSDARATAIAVAWAIADRTTISDGGANSAQESRDLAGLVAELAKKILPAAHPTA
jgi:hypothetical protein